MGSLPTVVGVDGSAAALDAVRWAVLDAHLHSSDLVLVSAMPLPKALTGVGILPEPVVEQSRSEIRTILDEARALASRVSATAGPIGIDTVSSENPAVATLLDLSTTARMVVIATRGLGGAEQRSLGSIGFAVTTHARCPVTVVRGWSGDGLDTTHPVVVGVDGTRASAAAVALAFEEASVRSAPLTAVHSWSDADLTVGLPIRGLEWPANRPAAADQLTRMLEPHTRRHPTVAVRTVVVKDRPVQALLDHAQGTQLLVIGSHGRGGYGEMMLGSTSRSVLARAHCPVTVVPSPGRRLARITATAVALADPE
ncbi:universal stress protein [Rhodococcus sp. IEGM 1401]|uniref:universal stress protein n=1 Tax=unclassified Rhodococcus (in: high G+C Gram-positive bacteria) TaxID=192944 RepID=UPI0022B3F80C|nr:MULTISPECIES: universal stress protein [unclassified Rhodococcus (in: high G+C Gram-positive bacteria)]MCZ4561509.1 universal stress protein [Rhodococcus sp. IEGM 1401]MDI9921611.1 universal stress protein [Rhodococcus sp. IEGM 1372]MDV8034063.1 universal stress protein [Rhodococcus sp. IEGM 1414]